MYKRQLLGRPYGGTGILINKKYISVAENIISQDRFTAVKINNWLLITVYMPCAGTAQRDLLYDDVVHELQALINQYPSCDCLIGEILMSTLIMILLLAELLMISFIRISCTDVIR